MLRLPAILAVLGLAGCVPAGTTGVPAPAPVQRVSGLTLIPGPGGLTVGGSGGREIGFGRDRPGVLESVAKVTGAVPVAVACPAAGRDGFRVGLDLVIVFEGKTFVGWETTGARAGRSC